MMFNCQQKNKILKSQFLLLVACCAYKLLLEIIYSISIVKLFAYARYENNPIVMNVIIGWFCFLILLAVLPKKDFKISSFANYIIFFISIIPNIILYEFGNCGFRIHGIICGAFLLQCLILRMNIFDDIHFKKIRRVKYDSQLFQKIFWCIFGIIAVCIVALFGMPDLNHIGLDNISFVRANGNYGKLVSISLTFLGKIIIPVTVAVAIKDRKWMILLIALMLQGYIYSVTGVKTYLFNVVIVILYMLYWSKNQIRYITCGIGTLTLVAYLGYLMTGKVIIIGIIPTRFLFLPAQIKIAYFDFFSRHPFLWYSENTIGKILGLDTVYDESIKNVIGRIYFGKPEMWTNTGYVADAYSNGGVVNVIVIVILLSLILKIFDHLISGRVNVFLANALVMLFAISLNDGGLIYVMGTGGMLVALLLFVFIDFDNSKEPDLLLNLVVKKIKRKRV